MSEQKELKVELIQHTPLPQELIALSAKLCYSKSSIDDLKEKISLKDQSAFIDRLMNMGHESILEHVTFTFGIEGVSRVLLAQLTRHRIASFSVQSQRYVSYEKGFGYIIPESILALGDEAVKKYAKQMDTIESWYVDWQQQFDEVRQTKDFYNRMTICFVMRIAMFFLPGIRPENEKRSSLFFTDDLNPVMSCWKRDHRSVLQFEYRQRGQRGRKDSDRGRSAGIRLWFLRSFSAGHTRYM